MEGAVVELPSERDRNFLITVAGGARWVLKLANAEETGELLGFQEQILERLTERAPSLRIPVVRRSTAGNTVETVSAPDGTPHLARVLSWVPGRELARVNPHSSELLRSLGKAVAQFDSALAGFHHPAATRTLKWDLERSGWIRGHLHRIADPARQAKVSRHLDRFESQVIPALPRLRRGVIHHDANDWNVLVDGPTLDECRVVGLLDLGDALESIVVADLAVACAYAMQGKRDPLAEAALVVAGYHSEYPLTELELEVLYPLICIRLAVSVTNSAEQRAAFPDDDYLTISESGVWQTLERLEPIHPRLAHYTFRAAAGITPCPNEPQVTEWLRRAQPRSLVGARGDSERLDLSVRSPLIETPQDPMDLPAFSARLFAWLRARGATVGVGAYDEARVLYTGAGYHDDGRDREVPRSVHIGLDLFADAGTEVYAPLDGIVDSVRDNGMDCDYGPTLVLRHAPAGGPVFHTLYGHLGRGVLEVFRPGDRVTRGDPIATIGDMNENGSWPPHLHFQVITDLLDREGEFPGVARGDQRDVWKSLSPDPNLIARLPAKLVATHQETQQEMLERRRASLGPSLSVSYRRPLTVVRGWKQWLFDENGLRYLDAVNNVAHVGHSHPRVVAAIREQAAVLNTNTRYLHPKLAAYAERLTWTLPAPLRVCYLVNSGSEANELAIRLARAATGGGRRGMVVVDVGYHGNTTTLVDVSPYKHDGPGGRGPPSWARKIPMPDGYRGTGLDVGRAVSEAIAALEQQGERPAAFLAESVLSCGGQVVLPPGFLAEAYRLIRAAGGVTIADEVQTGLGRVGTHWWAFETQGVIPDIVTMGKPIGNGHPLGAVVTTAEIAAAFDNGMEYFNTFGGNPVSCGAGLAVLEVLEVEGLRENAASVGTYLLEGLQGLVGRHPAAGNARGLGLFLGLELVRDGETREPAGPAAGYVANRMRESGVLVSTDGPHHNVLKIKPPLCFTREDADLLVATLDRVLGEDVAAGRMDW